MDLNAYVLAIAMAGVPRHQKNRQTVPEPEFKPFDLRYLRGLPAKTSQPRHISRRGKTQNNVSEAPAILPVVGELRESGAISSRSWPMSAECDAPKLERRTPSLERIYEIRA
jgi:hypothetical protein